MLRPQFRYSHALVGELLEIEAARAWVEARQAHLAARANGGGHTAALLRIGRKSNECLTEDTVRELSLALGADAASYRHASGLMYNQAHSDLVYIPPDASDVPDLMADLIEWLETLWDSAPAVVLAGVLEEEIALIQPFERHNAELARLAGDTVLLRRGYTFAPAVQPHLAAQRSEYVRASNAVHSGVFSEQADLTHWLEYYAGAIAKAAEEVRDSVAPAQQKAGPPESSAPGGTPVILRDRQLQALKHIREHGAIRSGEYQKLAGIVPDTARRDFDDLMAKDLIEVRGVGRATHYVLTPRGAEQAERRRIG